MFVLLLQGVLGKTRFEKRVSHVKSLYFKRYAKRAFYFEDESRSVIVLKPKDLKNFANGKAVLSVEASRELPLQQQTEAGGVMRWSYRSTMDASVTN
jgi:hypothetical protein